MYEEKEFTYRGYKVRIGIQTKSATMVDGPANYVFVNDVRRPEYNYYAEYEQLETDVKSAIDENIRLNIPF